MDHATVFMKLRNDIETEESSVFQYHHFNHIKMIYLPASDTQMNNLLGYSSINKNFALRNLELFEFHL